MCNELEKAFKKHFKMKILGSIKHILGRDVYNNLDEHKVYISQRQYIVDSVKGTPSIIYVRSQHRSTTDNRI